MNQAIQKRDDPSQLVGSYRDPEAINARLQYANENYHLISPATSVGVLPEGWSIAFSMVLVEIQRETYPVAGGGAGDGDDDTAAPRGKRGLSKSPLQRIASAMAIDWHPVISGRVDNGSDPRYCRWRAYGAYRGFDTQWQSLLAEKEFDLRDGSPTVLGLEAQARRKKRTAENQVRELRMHIQGHAETKAQLRAIRSLGLQTSYTTEELKRPFVAVRIMFTGQTNDPVLRAEFARMMAATALESRRTLYGGVAAAPPTAALPAGLASLGALPAPPVGTVRLDEEDIPEFVEPRRAAPRPQPAERARPSDQNPAAGSSAQTAPRDYSGVEMPFGDSEGLPIEETPDRDLKWMATHIRKQLDGNKSRFPEKDRRLLSALEAEIAHREGEGGDQGGKY